MEELDFEVKLTSNSIDRCPGLKICINDSVYFSGEVLGENIVTFKASITDDFNLNISYAGNNPQDLILDDEGMPTNSVTVTIDSIKIEGVDITEIAYNYSKFKINKSQKYIDDYELTECMDLGLQGVWTLYVESPVYIWMLENL